MNCVEQNFGIIGNVVAFGLEQLDFTFSPYIPHRVLRSGEINEMSDGTLIPMKAKTAKASEVAVRGRGGDGYEVNLSWQVDRPSAEDLNVLEDLKRNAKHLKINGFGDAVAYVCASEDHYRFDYLRNGEVVNCTLVVHNINGIQQYIP